MIEAYPLQWPPGWKRTQLRQKARFDTPFGRARNELLFELRRLGAKNVIISSNIPLRRDGLPYADYREPADPGVAVYFEMDGKNQCFPCDRWSLAVDNLQAIRLTVQALRGLERWGAKDMVAAAFRGFQALPEHTHADTVNPIVTQDFFAGCVTPDEIKARRRNLARDLHPDKKSGDSKDFTEMMQQYDKKMKEIT